MQDCSCQNIQNDPKCWKIAQTWRILKKSVNFLNNLESWKNIGEYLSNNLQVIGVVHACSCCIIPQCQRLAGPRCGILWWVCRINTSSAAGLARGPVLVFLETCSSVSLSDSVMCCPGVTHVCVRNLSEPVRHLCVSCGGPTWSIRFLGTAWNCSAKISLGKPEEESTTLNCYEYL